jgi:hypothetical protein
MKMEQKNFESSCAQVYYLPDLGIGKIIWRGSVTQEEYKKPFLALVDLASKGKKVLRFLSDTRNQGVVSLESRKWFEKEMVPLAIVQGLMRGAVVSNSNMFKTYYINLILSTTQKLNRPFKVFNDEQKAIEFLMAG